MTGSIRRRSKSTWKLTIDQGRDPRGKRVGRFVNVKGNKVEVVPIIWTTTGPNLGSLLLILATTKKGLPA